MSFIYTLTTSRKDHSKLRDTVVIKLQSKTKVKRSDASTGREKKANNHVRKPRLLISNFHMTFGVICEVFLSALSHSSPINRYYPHRSYPLYISEGNKAQRPGRLSRVRRGQGCPRAHLPTSGPLLSPRLTVPPAGRRGNLQLRVKSCSELPGRNGKALRLCSSHCHIKGSVLNLFIRRNKCFRYSSEKNVL